MTTTTTTTTVDTLRTENAAIYFTLISEGRQVRCGCGCTEFIEAGQAVAKFGWDYSGKTENPRWSYIQLDHLEGGWEVALAWRETANPFHAEQFKCRLGNTRIGPSEQYRGPGVSYRSYTYRCGCEVTVTWSTEPGLEPERSMTESHCQLYGK